jgi:hypothetical protein
MGTARSTISTREPGQLPELRYGGRPSAVAREPKMAENCFIPVLRHHDTGEESVDVER